jgi:hypothetical protein
VSEAVTATAEGAGAEIAAVAPEAGVAPAATVPQALYDMTSEKMYDCVCA